MSNRICKICGEIMTNEDQLAECRECGSLYHLDCFEELGGCANPDCENYKEPRLSLYELSSCNEYGIPYENEDDYIDDESDDYTDEYESDDIIDDESDDIIDENESDDYAEEDGIGENSARIYSSYESSKGFSVTRLVAFILAGLFIVGAVIGVLRLF